MKKILYIEDDPDLQVLVTRLMRRQNCQMLLAGDGQTGVALAGTESPDLILLDWRLPDISGGEVIKQLKRSETTRRIPILVVTADAYPKDEVVAREAGCDDFETKPLDFARLLAKIQALLDRGRE